MGKVAMQPQGGYVERTDGTTVHMADGLQKKWRDNFTGVGSINDKKWDVVQGPGMTLDRSVNGELKIQAGTTANSETILTSKEVFTIPFRAMFGFTISQRIANQDVYMEIVQVDPDTLDPLSDGGTTFWRVSYEDIATANYAVFGVNSRGGVPFVSAAVNTTLPFATQFNLAELELFADEHYFHMRVQDAAIARGFTAVRHNNIPDPNGVYKVRIRVKNKAVAPASNTDYRFALVTVQDIVEHAAEITGGRGANAASQSIPVQMVNTPSVTANLGANIPIATVEYSTAQTVSTTTSGTVRDVGGSTQGFSRCRVTIQHTGTDICHLIYEQGDSTTTFETHRIPIPGDGKYRTFEFPINARYFKIRIGVGSNQSALKVLSTWVRTDGPFDLDKTINFTPSTGAQTANNTSIGATAYNLGTNHSFKTVAGWLTTDQAGTFYVEQSRDGTNWRVTKKYTITPAAAGTMETFPFDDIIRSQYVRARHSNGATATGSGFEIVVSLLKN